MKKLKIIKNLKFLVSRFLRKILLHPKKIFLKHSLLVEKIDDFLQKQILTVPQTKARISAQEKIVKYIFIAGDLVQSPEVYKSNFYIKICDSEPKYF